MISGKKTKVTISMMPSVFWLEAASHRVRLLLGSVVDELARNTDDIDVYVISGEHDDSRPPSTRLPDQSRERSAYGWVLGVVVGCTALDWLLFPVLEKANLVMVYLLGVTLVAMRCGRLAAITASVLSVAAFDYFFVSPRFYG